MNGEILNKVTGYTKKIKSEEKIMGKIKLRKQMVDILRYKLYGANGGLGASRDDEKRAGTAGDKIFSMQTFKTYHQQVDHFADWCKEHGITGWDAARLAVSEYLKYLIEMDYAAPTIKTAACALGKVWSCDYRDFGVVLPKCERVLITRSRQTVKRDAHFSIENNAELINFGACTGLRRAELEHIVGTDLYEKDGKYYIHVRGKAVHAKGGKVRDVELIGNEKEIKAVVDRMLLAKDGLVWTIVHSSFDEHAQRNVYSWRVYNKYKRDLSTLPREELYICRKDRAGERFDKAALEITSQFLGHGHYSDEKGKWIPRADITVRNYLH